MSFVSVTDSVLSLATTVGFAVPGWQPLAIASATAEMLLGFFYPADQSSAVDQFAQVEDQVIDAISDEGQVILGGVWQDFSDNHLAEVETAQSTYAQISAKVMRIPEGQDAAGPTRVDATEFSFWQTSINAQTGSTSPLLNACNFIALKTDYANTSINLYLLAATVFLNYCKVGLILEMVQCLADYQQALTKAKAEDKNTKPPPPPESYADLTQSTYYGTLVAQLTTFIAYAKPITTSMMANFATIDQALETRAREFTLKHAADGWYYQDSATGSTSTLTDRDTASNGMQLEIGMAQSQLEGQLLAQYGLERVARTDAAGAQKSVAALEKTAQGFPAQEVTS